jgi:demethylmenaquinone methyltransferase/2-methoxy-6-polyprenyl-1,4-benzoquinol methylase
VTDIDTFVQIAHVFDALREPVLLSAIQDLQLPLGSRGLDAGCGIGLQALLLAAAVGPAGHITGLDLSPHILIYAEDMVKQAGLSERITFRQGDVRQLPFDDDAFDWAWSVDCVGYAPMEPLPLVQELARVVKPGGWVALLAWSSEKLLPGYPLLEARLNATSAGIAPFVPGKKPESHFLRALGWFRDAGLQEPRVRTFAGDAYAPLTDELYSALTALFQMRWPGVESELTQAEADGEHLVAEYRRLCLPESPDFILDHPDYYALFTYSMFHGKVAEE